MATILRKHLKELGRLLSSLGLEIEDESLMDAAVSIVRFTASKELRQARISKLSHTGGK